MTSTHATKHTNHELEQKKAPMPTRDGKIIYMQRCMQHEYVIFLCATITSCLSSSFFPSISLSLYMCMCLSPSLFQIFIPFSVECCLIRWFNNKQADRQSLERCFPSCWQFCVSVDVLACTHKSLANALMLTFEHMATVEIIIVKLMSHHCSRERGRHLMAVRLFSH